MDAPKRIDAVAILETRTTWADKARKEETSQARKPDEEENETMARQTSSHIIPTNTLSIIGKIPGKD